MQIRKALGIMALCLLMISGCKEKKDVSVNKSIDDTTFVFKHEPVNAIYHWKTIYSPNEYEIDFLNLVVPVLIYVELIYAIIR